MDEKLEAFASKVQAVTDPAERRRLEDEIERMRSQGLQAQTNRALLARVAELQEAVLHLAAAVSDLQRRVGE